MSVLLVEKLTVLRMESSSSPSAIIPSEGSTKIILKLAESLPPQEELEKQPNQTSQADIRKLQPEWLERFIKRTFFDPCSEHPTRRNELNKYCIDCDASLCQYCLSPASHADNMSPASHEDHRLLKIYRHVYKDVVPLDEIEQHIDCSQIQSYRCNKQLVIALTPLPHSGGKASEEAACQTCKRKLMEYELNNYCSIACKAEAFSKKEHDTAPPFLLLDPLVQKGKLEPELKKPTLDQLAQKAEEASDMKSTLDEVVLKPNQEGSFRKRKRKGTPHRAPFF